MTTATMPLFIIDTLKFSRRLQQAGMASQVADELAESLQENCNTTEGLATKEDVVLLKQDATSIKQDIALLKQDIRHLDQKFEQKIENLENKLIIKIFFMLTATIAIIAWLDKVIH